MIAYALWIVPVLFVGSWLYRSRIESRTCRVAARTIHGTVGYGSGNATYVEGTLDGFRLKATVGRISVEACGAFPLVRLKLTQQAPLVEEGPLGLFSLEGNRTPGPFEEAIEAFRERGRGWDVLVGDTGFDSAVVVDGPEADALAVLDAASRGCVIRLQRLGLGQFTLSPVELVAEGAPISDGRELVRRIEEFIGLVKAVARRGNIPERLAVNARADPIADVRLRNLDILIDQYSEWPGTAPACRVGLADRNPWIRLRAAVGLGKEGLGALRESALCSSRNEGLAAAALESLLAIGEREQAASVCLEVLSSGKGEARRRAIETLGRLRHTPALEDLVRALSESDQPVVARALTLIGGEQAEAALRRALSGSVGDSQTEIIRGLGAIGSVEAIGTLRAVADGAHVNRAARRLAEEAIRRIQSRLTDADAGQLALADLDPQRGALSVIEPHAEEGCLSLPDPDSAPAPSDPSGLRQGPR